MNWKIILGILLIYAAAQEAFAMKADYDKGISTMPPIYAVLCAIPLTWLGFYLIYKGRKPKKLK